MAALTCDVAIVGAGTAGLAAERSARRAGASTLLIDDRFAGTTCATVGCMPSKLLIAAANVARTIRRSSIFGIAAGEPVIDGVAVMARVREQRDAFAAGARKSFEQLPAGIALRGRAKFLDPTTLALEDGRRISAKAIVIATGARPLIPSLFDCLGGCLLTNETIFELRDLPKSLAVIGAGSLGLELAQAFSRLGVATQVFAEDERLGGLEDQQVAAELKSILEHELPIRLGVSLSVRRRGSLATIAWTGSTQGSADFERVLVATGRSPDLAGIDLSAANLNLDRHGTPHFNRDTLQCGESPVFIAGDAAADRPVLHEASSEGAIAGRNAASFPVIHPARRGPQFSIMFTDPPVAVIGNPARSETISGHASFDDQGRAKIEGRNAGAIRVYAQRSDGRITGAALVGPCVDHIAHLLAWEIEGGATAASILDRPFYHPTFEEGLKPALREICKTVETPGAPDRDEGTPPGA